MSSLERDQFKKNFKIYPSGFFCTSEISYINCALGEKACGNILLHSAAGSEGNAPVAFITRFPASKEQR